MQITFTYQPLPGPPLPTLPHPSSPPRKVENGEGEGKKPNSIRVAQILTGVYGHMPGGQPHKENPSAPQTTLPEAVICEELHFTISVTTFKLSLQWLPMTITASGKTIGVRGHISSRTLLPELCAWRRACCLSERLVHLLPTC